MLLKTVVPKHSIGANVKFGLALGGFRFLTPPSMLRYERYRVGYSYCVNKAQDDEAQHGFYG